MAVCAGTDLMHPLGALVVGGVAGAIFVVMFTLTQNRWKIDDVLGVWPLHGLCGLWGGIAAGIFGSQALGGLGGVSLGAQLIGSLLGVAWALAGRLRDLRRAQGHAGPAAVAEEEHDGRRPGHPPHRLDAGTRGQLVSGTASMAPTGAHQRAESPATSWRAQICAHNVRRGRPEVPQVCGVCRFRVVVDCVLRTPSLCAFSLRSPLMGNKLYVGNLPYSFRDSDMEQAFSQFGTVTSAKVMMERDTGRSKGFGFVEMGSPAEAQAAIEGMNGQQIGGRGLVVNEARPMEARAPRSGGFGGGGGGGGGGRWRRRRWWRRRRRWRRWPSRRRRWRRRRRRRRWPRPLLSTAHCSRKQQRAYGPFFHACAACQALFRRRAAAAPCQRRG